MSNTLKDLYTDFRKRFGHFGAVSDEDPIFMAKRQELIELGLDGLEQGKDFYKTYTKMNAKSDEIGSVTSGDPIPSMVLLRLADEAVRSGLQSEIPKDMLALAFSVLEAHRSAAAGGTAFALNTIQSELDEMETPGAMPSELRALLASVRYLRQYALFRYIGSALNDKVEPRSFMEDWREGGFESFNDYSDVHPFLLAICPPHHIWQRFIFDGDVCEVHSDGTLKRAPLELCDSAKTAEPQKHYPFLHILNSTETYQIKS